MRYILPLLLLAGCASGPITTTSDVDPAIRADTLQAGYEPAFIAVMDGLGSKGWGIKAAKKDLGLIRTGWKQSSNVVGSKARSKYNARVEALDSTRTVVRITMKSQRQGMGMWSAASVSKERAHELYASAFETIRKQLP